MNLKNFILILIVFSFVSNFACAEERNLLQKAATYEQVKNALVYDKSWIKYPDYSDRAGWDKRLGEYKEKYIKEAEPYLNYKWKAIKVTDYLDYYRTGSRRTMEEPNDENIIAIVKLLLGELAEGKGRFTDQLMNMTFSSCEMTSWAIMAHINLQKTEKTFPSYKDEEQAIELVSGDLGAINSWVYYFMHKEFDKIEPAISKRLEYEINRRIMNSFMETNHFWWMGFSNVGNHTMNNWNPWCNSNVLQCFLIMENDKDKLAQAVFRTMKSVDQFINSVKEDGACEEGPSYWGHAAGKLYDYLQILSYATQGKISIFNQPLIKNMGEYISRSYVGNDWMVNFADASAKQVPNASLIYRYGNAVNSGEMKEFASFVKNIKMGEREAFEHRNIFRTFESIYYKDTINNIPSKHYSPDYTWYPQTQFGYMKNKNGLFFAAKGGHNNESHNHNDVGTFNFYIDKTPIIIDVGVGTYTKQTFSDDRYKIWTMQSQYHNLPVINGKEELFGGNNKASNVKFDFKKSIFSLDINTAYPELDNQTKWNREYQLKPNSLIINDRFSITNPTISNEIHFLSWGNISINNPGRINIDVDGKKAVLNYSASQFDVKIETIELTDKKLSDVWGNKIYRIKLIAKQIQPNGIYTYQISKK